MQILVKVIFTLVIVAGFFQLLSLKNSTNSTEFIPKTKQKSLYDKNNREVVYATYIDRMTSWWGWQPVARALHLPGPADAATPWAKPTNFIDVSQQNPFGTTDEEIRQSWLKLLHDKGKKVMLSAFGDSQHPASQGFDPVTTCREMAQNVKDWGLDGLDLDVEDNEGCEKGICEDWLVKCTQAARGILPQGQFLLTHAPQAPYFDGTDYYVNGGYITVHEKVGNLIDWYNVQFYNQADTRYDTYKELFTNATGVKFNRTSVAEIINRGVPQEMIIIGKPSMPQDAANTGYVQANEFAQWCKQAVQEGVWNNPGMFTWQLPSDPTGQFVSTYINVVGDKNKE